MKTAHLIPKQQ